MKAKITGGSAPLLKRGKVIGYRTQSMSAGAKGARVRNMSGGAVRRPSLGASRGLATATKASSRQVAPLQQRAVRSIVGAGRGAVARNFSVSTPARRKVVPLRVDFSPLSDMIGDAGRSFGDLFSHNPIDQLYRSIGNRIKNPKL